MRAAEYVRASTENQRYSIPNQRAVIAEYAVARGFEIVARYEDSGKSGLSLKGRAGLKALLADALTPDRSFDAILVLDVSRWGRFQDIDQAAHYEFICRQAGVRMIYCAEPFESDGSAVTSILKTLKRFMAGEYSRELSVKLSRAHLQQASLGFGQGGMPVYGFRRQLIDEHGVALRVLTHGEHKWIRNHRVVYIVGPPSEQAVIRRIFRLYAHKRWPMQRIASVLQGEVIPANRNAQWSADMVRTILTCELCIGTFTYNKTQQKLQATRRANPEAVWTRAATGFAPLVSAELFAAAQARLKENLSPRYTDEKLLANLTAAVSVQGRLSKAIAAKTPQLPSPTTYSQHFGSFGKALERIGYVPPFIMRGREEGWTKEQLRTGLRTIYDREGYLSRALIDLDADLPSAQCVRKHVGSLAEAYAFIGLGETVPGEYQRLSISRRADARTGKSLKRRGGVLSWTERLILERLGEVLKANGFLSTALIEETRSLPSISTIVNHFGTLSQAYRAVGWNVSKAELFALRSARNRKKKLGRGRNAHSPV